MLKLKPFKPKGGTSILYKKYQFSKFYDYLSSHYFKWCLTL